MKLVKTFLSIILSIMLISSLFTVSLIINISHFFKVDSMEKTIKNINISHEINKIQNSSATSEEKSEIADIINSAYEEAENHGISGELVDTIFDSNEVKQFLGKIVGTTTDNIINNNKEKSVTSEDFNQLIDDNIDKWIKESNIDISDSKKEVLVIRMKSVGKGIVENLPISENIVENIDQDYLNIIQFIFSFKVKLILISISLISLVSLILLNRKKSTWLLYSGFSTLLTSIGLISISIIIFDIITYILKGYNLSFMISAFSNTLSKNVMITGFIFLIISLILFTIYYLKHKKTNQLS